MEFCMVSSVNKRNKAIIIWMTIKQLGGNKLKAELNPPIAFSQGRCHLGLCLSFNCHDAAYVISFDTSHWMVWKFGWQYKQKWQLPNPAC